MEKRGLAISGGIVCGKVLIFKPYTPDLQDALDAPDVLVVQDAQDALDVQANLDVQGALDVQGTLDAQAELNALDALDALEVPDALEAPDAQDTPDVYDAHGAQSALDAYARALDCAMRELDDIIEAIAESDPEKAEIFQAHQMLLEDAAISQKINELIIGGMSAPQAVADAFAIYIKIFSRAENSFTSERIADLKDVRNRVLRCLEGKPEVNLSLLPAPSIIFARELLPSDTVTIDRKNVLAIVTELGGVTSHMAIIASSYGIPAVLGVEGILSCAANGDKAIVDAEDGIVVLRPDAKKLHEYHQKQEECDKIRRVTRLYRNVRAVTQDGSPVAIELNISSTGAVPAEDISASDGAGLMRSEFLYMQSNGKPPSEEAQFQEYKAAATAFQGKPVVLRTLDIGGDKQLPYLPLPKEENPFLGKRGLRLCLEEKDIFRTQIRAALRASYFGNLWLMFPMVGSLDDFRSARSFVRMAMDELDKEGTPYNKGIPLGIMIEVPSIALMADQVAREVDFASIGTNDLCQYLMAVDRLNPAVAPYYQSYSPSVFRLVRYVAEQFNIFKKHLSVCGEMGGSPGAVIALIGLGIRALSMSPSRMAAVKQAITGTTTHEAQRIAAAVCDFETADEVSRILTETAETIALKPVEARQTDAALKS